VSPEGEDLATHYQKENIELKCNILVSWRRKEV